MFNSFFKKSWSVSILNILCTSYPYYTFILHLNSSPKTYKYVLFCPEYEYPINFCYPHHFIVQKLKDRGDVKTRRLSIITGVSPTAIMCYSIWDDNSRAISSLYIILRFQNNVK